MPRIKLEFCDVVIALDIADRTLYKQTIGRYKLFLTSKSADLNIGISTKDGLLCPQRDGAPTLAILKGGKEIFIKRHDILSAVSLSRKTGSAYLSNALITFECFLRMIFSYILLRSKNGFLPHAAGLKVNGSGFLFPGMSGAGKTTLYRKAGERYVLTDELTGVIKAGGRFLLCGTPFMGEFHTPVSRDIVPLRAIFFLAKTTKLTLTKVSKADALVRFLSTILFFCDDVAINKRLLAQAKSIVESVPTFELGYDKDKTPFGEVLKSIASVT